MTYVKVQDDDTLVYPYVLFDLLKDFPDTSFIQPLEQNDLSDFGVFPVATSEPTAYNAATHKAVELLPILADGAWVQQWDIQPLSDEERDQYAAWVQAQVVAATQQRLDDFASTRNYDGILSLCTYATSPTAKFAAEGQYGVQARDATWAKLYEMLAEVEAGTRPMPSGYADIEPELPALAWPSIVQGEANLLATGGAGA